MLLRSGQLAERLGLSKITVIRMANNGDIPVAMTLPSGHMRFDEDEVRVALGGYDGDGGKGDE